MGVWPTYHAFSVDERLGLDNTTRASQQFGMALVVGVVGAGGREGAGERLTGATLPSVYLLRLLHGFWFLMNLALLGNFWRHWARARLSLCPRSTQRAHKSGKIRTE